VYGHQTAFWVMNDAANVHLETETEPLHVEVRATAFAVVSEHPALDRATFYRYELHYEGDAPLTDARFALFADADIGNEYTDDYLGSDPERGLGFMYNADNEDEGGYAVPPASGYDLLSGADALITFYDGIEPLDGEGFYNNMRGLWADGTPLTYGGSGFGGEIDTTWLFPGEVYPEPEFWSEYCLYPECTQSNQSGDRRYVIGTPAFDLLPGGVKTVDFALLFGQGIDHLHSVEVLIEASDTVQARYDAGALFAPGPPPPPVGTLPTPQLLAPADGADLEQEAVLEWTPVPGAARYRVELANNPDFADAHVIHRFGEDAATVNLTFSLPINEEVTRYWRVRAFDGLASSAYSDVRSFTFYRNQPA
ncbi:MAG: hypothetical protein R3362_11180, partial [Rhodothermales bacterium]|nr:hypothetical protein [Rhodothermales bacterium]